MNTSKLSLCDSELVRVVIYRFVCAVYNNASHDLYIVVEPRLAQKHR